MREIGQFEYFVIPFLFGMAFVLGYCLIGMVRVILELPKCDRQRFWISLITPKTIWKNIRDIFLNCLIHVKLWKRKPLLGFMHSSIAFGWFMLIVIGHVQVLAFTPGRIHTFYHAIFFNFFVEETEPSTAGAVLAFLMDFFLLMVLVGIGLAMVKRVASLLFGMRRTTRPSLLDRVGLYALWSIFPLRLLCEGFVAHVSGGSFLTLPLNWVFRQFLANPDNMVLTWWGYSLALCIFMCVLPFTRYMHIPAEMLLIPVRNAGIKIRHPRKGFAKLEVYSCPGCGVCIDACPMSVKKANIKDATVYLNRQLRRGNEKRIEEISDKCLLCGKCTALCQVGCQGPELRVAQRSLRSYGLTPDYAALPLDSLKARLSAPIEGDSSALSSADGLSSQPAGEATSGVSAAGVLYFAGCMTQLTPSISRATESVLRKAGVPFKRMDPMGEEGLCCGRPLLMAGRTDAARELMARNRELILASGCKTLLLSCPICYRVFAEEYDLPGVRVVHHSVYFEELAATGRLSIPRLSHRPLVYHDPCELGRGCGIYDEPRALLGRVGRVVEGEKHHEQAICCGGSLGSLSLNFNKRKDMTLNALQNLCVADPEAIVTACPLCESTFARYADRPVRDIAEVVDAAVPASAPHPADIVAQK